MLADRPKSRRTLFTTDTAHRVRSDYAQVRCLCPSLVGSGRRRRSRQRREFNPRLCVQQLRLKSSPYRRPLPMRKLFALALLALALAGGMAVVSVEQSTPARADCGGCG